ncbi:hypothetical protein AAC387_Pa01g0080 [Persea americana]
METKEGIFRDFKGNSTQLLQQLRSMAGPDKQHRQALSCARHARWIESGGFVGDDRLNESHSNHPKGFVPKIFGGNKTPSEGVFVPKKVSASIFLRVNGSTFHVQPFEAFAN